MFDSPRLWPGLIYGMVFAAGWTLVQFGSGMWNVLGNALALVGGLLMGITVLIYIGHWMTFFIDVIMQAFTKTKASTLARELQGLTQEQVSIVRSQGEISLGLRLTAKGPRYYVWGTSVPLDFLKFEFLPRCAMDNEGVTHTAPIGSWADGKTWKDYGPCRMLAREFTQHLVSNGLAVWGAGNQSAKLVGDLTAFELRKMLGMIDKSTQMSDIGSTEEEAPENS